MLHSSSGALERLFQFCSWAGSATSPRPTQAGLQQGHTLLTGGITTLGMSRHDSWLLYPASQVCSRPRLLFCACKISVHTRLLERDYAEEHELVFLKAAKSGVNGKGARTLWTYFGEAVEDCRIFESKEMKEWGTVLLTEDSEFGNNNNKKKKPLKYCHKRAHCAEKPILEPLCSWENSAPMWQ